MGAIPCEPSGIFNINRSVALTLKPVKLHRQFTLTSDEEVRFEFGFSDEMTLIVDGSVIFDGENRFLGFTDRIARGYVELGRFAVQQNLSEGLHQLDAIVTVKEGFGWGLILTAFANTLSWQPVT